MLNPMVQSDLVTYRGGTILILFLQPTNENNDQLYLDEINILSKLLRIYYGYEPLIMSQNINRVVLTTDSILAILFLQE